MQKIQRGSGIIADGFKTFFSAEGWILLKINSILTELFPNLSVLPAGIENSVTPWVWSPRPPPHPSWGHRRKAGSLWMQSGMPNLSRTRTDISIRTTTAFCTCSASCISAGITESSCPRHTSRDPCAPELRRTMKPPHSLCGEAVEQPFFPSRSFRNELCGKWRLTCGWSGHLIKQTDVCTLISHREIPFRFEYDH